MGGEQLPFVGLISSAVVESPDQRMLTRSVASRYVLTSFIVAPCCAFRLQPPWHAYSFFLFIPAVLAGAVLFGRGPAIYATALTGLVAALFFVEPVFSLSLTPSQVPPLALYLLICGSLAESCEWLKRIVTKAMKPGAVASRMNRSAEVRNARSPAAPGRARVDGIDFWR